MADWYIYVETDGGSFHLPILVLLLRLAFLFLFKISTSPADFTIRQILQSFFVVGNTSAFINYHDFRSF